MLPLALPLFVARNAEAQAWLKDRRFQEGAGIRTGDLELHPGVAGEVGYDSNYFLRSDATGPGLVNGAPAAPVRDAAVFRLTPSLTLSTLGPQRLADGTSSEPPKVTFRAGVNATYREFLGVQEIRDQRNVSGGANARVDILPGRPWGAGLFVGYTRLIQPSVIGDPNLSFNRSDVTVGGELIAVPNNGTLDLRLGYQLMGSLFEQSQGAPFTSMTHEVSVRNRWRFRPRTALFHYTTLRFITYPNADRSVNYLDDSSPLRSQLGVTGLVTPRVSVLAAGGYGASFFSNPSSPAARQYDSVTAQAEATFYLSGAASPTESAEPSFALSAIVLGYSRDFQNSLLGNFYGSDRGYAKISYFFGGKALISLDGSVGAIEYPDIFLNPGGGGPPVLTHGSFTDIRALATLFAEYRLADSFGLNTTVNYSQNFSKTTLNVSGPGPAGPATPPALYDLSWKRLEAYLGARWFL